MCALSPPCPTSRGSRRGAAVSFAFRRLRAGADATLRSVLHNVYVHTFEFKELGSVTGDGQVVLVL